MNLAGNNPTSPILTAFLAYSREDAGKIESLVRALRVADVEVLAYGENEPTGIEFSEWIAENISCADCIIVVISDSMLQNPQWVESEVGFAIDMLVDNGILHHAIIPVLLEGNNTLSENFHFQPRNFGTGKPNWEPIVWIKKHCHMIEQDGVNLVVKKFVLQMKPTTTLIDDLGNR